MERPGNLSETRSVIGGWRDEIQNRYRSFRAALRGFGWLILSERHFQLHLVAANLKIQADWRQRAQRRSSSRPHLPTRQTRAKCDSLSSYGSHVRPRSRSVTCIALPARRFANCNSADVKRRKILGCVVVEEDNDPSPGGRDDRVVNRRYPNDS